MEESLNPYLALRARKIARNEAKLAELGLLRRPTPKSSTNKAATSKSRRKSPHSMAFEPLRRSSRKTDRPLFYSAPDPIDPITKRPRTCTTRSTEAQDEMQQQPPSPTFPPSSVRSMQVHAKELLLGNASHPEGLLGMALSHTGKAAVMEESVRRCCPETKTLKLSFNKYCGVQEWKNDVLFLWVNLGNNGEFVNEFLDGGRLMTWFGGSRMHDETNVIRRLIRVGNKAARGELHDGDGIVLWCRTHDASSPPFTPYICFGRLAYHSHESGSRPIKFVWKLLDYDQLLKSERGGSLLRSMLS